jgi:hypothetical protein
MVELIKEVSEKCGIGKRWRSAVAIEIVVGWVSGWV